MSVCPFYQAPQIRHFFSIFLDKKVIYCHYNFGKVFLHSGVCSREIQFDVENDIIKEVRFIGGCMGNTQGVAALAKGRNIDEVINTIKGIDCGGRGTSCPDQLALALIAYKEQQA